MKKITFLILFVFSACLVAHSQVTVGTGTLTNQSLPFNPGSQYSYSQSIYLASEINAAGTITSLQWYYSNTTPGDLPNSQDLVIYIGKTTKQSFISTGDWISTANMTQVFAGGIVTGGTSGWKTIILDTPFVYDGTENLVVAVDESYSGADAASDKFYNTSTGTVKRSIFKTSTTDLDPTALPTGSTVAVIPNVIFGGIAQGCLTPNGVSVSNITTTTATVTWTTSGAQPTGGTDYYLSTSSTSPVEGTIPTGTVATGTTLNLTELTSGTYYCVWVRNNCGSGSLSSWSNSACFTTVCNPVTLFNENFDGVTAPQLPSCWSKILRGPSVAGALIETSSLAANQVFSSPNSLRMFNATSSESTDDIILVSPQLTTLGLGTYRMKFYAKQSNLNGGIIQIGTLNSNTGTAVFTPLPGFDNLVITNTSVEYTVSFSNYTGSDTYVGIRMQAGSSYSTTMLDNIRWEAIPLCADVTNIIVPEISGEWAILSWVDGVNATDTTYEVVVGPDTTTDPSTLTPIPATTTIKKVEGLTGSTTYKAWVRSVCHNGPGLWVGPIVFTTECPSVAAFRENFDGYTVVPNQLCCNVLPDCWSKIIRGQPYNPTYTFVQTSSHQLARVSSLPNAIQMANSSNSTATTDIILVSPNLNTLGLGTYRLRFSARQNVVINSASVIVGTLNNGLPTAIFTPYQVVYIDETTKEYIVSFNGYNTTDTHIGIRMNSQDSPVYVGIDDVIWEKDPLCADVSQIQVSETTPDSATFLWNANGGESAWQIVIGAASSNDPDSLSPIDATTNPKTVTGLAHSTSYRAWIRSNCQANGEYGAWIGPVDFKTPCPAVSTINENFDSSGTVPPCWTKILRGPTLSSSTEIKITGNANYVYSTPNAAWLYKGEYEETSRAVNDLILETPYLTNVFSGNYRLKFFAMLNPNGNSGGKIEIGTLDNNTINAYFNPIKEITLTNKMIEYVVDFTATGGTDSYIGFRISTSFALNVYIDNVIWEPIPTCPEANNLVVSTIASDSVSLSWNPGGKEESWDVVYGLSSVADPNTLSPTNTVYPSLSISGLSASTDYKAWVRSVCPLGDKGPWVALSFRTPCVTVASLNENVDSTTLPNLPTCWSKILRGATLDPNARIISVNSNYLSPPNAIEIRSNQSKISDDIILVSPNLSTLSSGTHTLKFWAKTDAELQVGTMTNNTNSGMMNLIKTLTPAGYNSYTEYTVPFTTYAGVDNFIGIRLNSALTSQFVYIDNISFDGSLSTVHFDASELNYYPNPVTDILNISYIDNITNVSVFNVLGQKVMTSPVNGNWTKIDMSGFTAGTYLVKVQVGESIETIKVLKL